MWEVRAGGASVYIVVLALFTHKMPKLSRERLRRRKSMSRVVSIYNPLKANERREERSEERMESPSTTL